MNDRRKKQWDANGAGKGTREKVTQMQAYTRTGIVWSINFAHGHRQAARRSFQGAEVWHLLGVWSSEVCVESLRSQQAWRPTAFGGQVRSEGGHAKCSPECI
jgi:hypothetical protein